MRKQYNFYITILFFLLTNSINAQIVPNNYWTQINSENGLVDNEVTAIKVLNDTSIWVGTPKGLSYIKGSVITNYTSSNSNLNSDNILELVFAHDMIWAQTDSGLSSFDGLIFTNYTRSSGLIDSKINGLAVTPSDTLWVGTDKGVSKFDGQKFVNDSSKVAFDIESDSLGRIYIMNTVGRTINIDIYDSSRWNSYLLPSTIRHISGIKRLFNGELVLLGIGSLKEYYRLDYPNNVVKKELQFHSTISVLGPGSGSFFNDLQKDKNRIWAISKQWDPNRFKTSIIVSSSIDSVFYPHLINKKISTSNTISLTAELVFIGTDLGVFYSTKDNKSEEGVGVVMDVNNIQTNVYPSKPVFTDLKATANFEFPKGNGSHGIFSTDFILIAKNTADSAFRVSSFNGFGDDYAKGPKNNTAGLSKNYIYKISKSDIETHKLNYNKSGYTAPKEILEWPALGDSLLGMARDLAPFVDVNTDGCYKPLDGDYPLIYGDQAIYWINHEINEGAGNDLGLEYHWMLYGFDQSSDSGLNQTLFLNYTIVNRDSIDYDSVKLGLYADYDLGAAIDDYVGCDSISNIAYVYNGDSDDEDFAGSNGFGKNPPVVGHKFLSDSMDTHIYYNRGTAPNEDPELDIHWVNYLNAKWKNGDHVTYGGNGYNVNTSSSKTKYMFTGDAYSNSGWNEKNDGNPQGDRRSVSSIPYFSLKAGERKTVEIVFGYGQLNKTQTAVGENVPELIRILNKAKQTWDTTWVDSSSLATKTNCKLTSVAEINNPEESSLKVYPIPTQDRIRVESEKAIIEYELYDLKGSRLNGERINDKAFELSLSSLQNGLYFIRLYDDNGKWSNRKVVLNK